MQSRDKRRIARTNGAKATGTKTPDGLRKSAQNSIRHGLTAETLVLSNESQNKFDELMEAFIRKFQPKDQVELELVTEMVAARWRLRRVWLIQTAALDLQMDRMVPEIAEQFEIISQPTRLSLAFTTLANQEKSLQLLLRYETTYSRAFDRALKTLDKIQNSHTQSIRTEELRNEPKTPVAPQASLSCNENSETMPVQQPPPDVETPKKVEATKKIQTTNNVETTNDANPQPALRE